ncbi:3-methyl-2-oxobutanoate hydroxymethyltransferase [Amphibacillus marinus]|uniref:3-methyl-2-oxobutanoate hydroxymethyltransferase n=1 Tax=Amphibacillus marinus TaxID=872970 RepID=A0A1H8GIC6_9BACI|nr:3-methyl-2-oxobutanoate hydroxymethyltransferase [Amphibacillus marinus]SEN43559.1 3-methyl-2-oxobutanoate hydroxymethyltransferase [Amphibacillus marinus]
MKTRIDLLAMKQKNDKITMVTAYDYPSAKLVEQAGVEMILVGDSLGMVVLGYESTINVTIEDMIHHGKAARKGAQNTFIVLDMPFMSYHVSLVDSLRNATRIFQETQAQAIKVEGATEEVRVLIERLTQGGIPVVGHIGLTPQSVHVFGGFKIQGKDQSGANRILAEAKALEAAGAIACVLEGIPQELAEVITRELSIPTIGIGAGIHCDGQVLVYHDLLQYGTDRYPRFVKNYANVNQVSLTGLTEYVQDVKDNRFPEEKHTYTIHPDTQLPRVEE